MHGKIRTDGAGRRSKVKRVLEEYELTEVGDELERAWTATDPNERESLRDLATRLNQRILKEALQGAGETVLEGEAENKYQLLTDDGVSPGDRKRAERKLKRQGIDVEALRSDFVSYQAIRTYLMDYRDAELKTTDTDKRESAVDIVQRLQSRLVTVSEDRLLSLHSAEEISLGEFRVILNLRVVCEDCGMQENIIPLIKQGGCNCSS